MATTKTKTKRQSHSSGRSEGSRQKTRGHGRSRASESAAGKTSPESRRRAGNTRSESRRRSGAAGATTDHEEIRRWAEERGGKPACVAGTGGKGDTGMLRLDFPGYSGRGKLRHISWDQWFEKFDEKNLALLHQDRTAGGKRSNFNKLVER